MHKLLESHDHYCFHSVRGNVHQHPDLHRCTSDKLAIPEGLTDEQRKAHTCRAAVTPETAERAGLIDEKGSVTCPGCGSSTVLVPGKRKLEVHAKLCTDETIHYPEWRKTGKIDEETYQAWKGTLTREELLGKYERVPDVHVSITLEGDDLDLMESDRDSFNVNLNEKIKGRAEVVLLHQIQHRHTTDVVEL
ncbi:MAG TPA: hypothetical protein VK638_29040 [Edaphobacter sp.]|nr:hypothetical protein [Edaphobacter sp.]